MTITFNGKTIDVSERECFALSFALGIARRSEEARTEKAKMDEVLTARGVWVKLGILEPL